MSPSFSISDGASFKDVSVTDCLFESGSGLSLEGLPSGASISVREERFYRPSGVGAGLRDALRGRSGAIRLGPCPACGQLRERGPGGLLPHPAADLVRCVMES